MKISDLTDNLPKTAAIAIVTLLLFWQWGCPAQVPSLTKPGVRITRPELQIELDSIIATAEFRMAELEKQEQFRNIIFQNALLMVGGGTVNPVGILTGLAALYGLGTGAKQLKDKIKKNHTA